MQSVSSKIFKGATDAGRNLTGKTTGNYHLKILCHEQSLPLSVLLHPENKNTASCLSIFNDALTINAL